MSVKNISAFLLGLIFGVGLIVAGMNNPAKVLAFLDVAGAWDPSLAWVMASALLILGVLQRFIKRSSESDRLPTASIDARLVVGAALFGVGWGLSGICPGPAIVGLTSGSIGIYAFVAAMFAGFLLFNGLHRR